MQNKKQLFNDGVCSIADIRSSSVAEVRYPNIRFEYRTVGEERFYKAAEQNHRIKHIIRIPKISGVQANQIFIIENVQHTAVQVQLIKDTLPPCWQVSLEERNKRIQLEVKNV